MRKSREERYVENEAKQQMKLGEFFDKTMEGMTFASVAEQDAYTNKIMDRIFNGESFEQILESIAV